MRSSLLVLVFTLSLVPLLTGSPVRNAAAADIETMISSAKTPADHEAIAAYYDQEAKVATEKAALHKKMGEDYKAMPGALSAKTHLHEHCEGLVKIYTAQAKEFAAMAAAHREMAKAAK